MQKKIICVLVILVFIIFISVPAFARPLDDYADYMNNNNIPVDGIVGDAAYIEQKEDSPVGEDISPKSEKDIEDVVEEIDPLEELLQRIIKSKDIGETKHFIVTFTQPLDNCIVYDNQNFICGFTNSTNKENIENGNNLQSDNIEDAGNTETEEIITVILTRYNEETDTYEEYKNTEGESRWSIGSFGLFTKVVDLLKGINKLKIIIFRRPAGLLETNPNSEVIDKNSENIDVNDVNNVNAGANDNNIGNIDSTDSIAAGPNRWLETVSKAEVKAEDIAIEAGKNLQISYFTINVLNEATKDELINKPAQISNMFANIFPN